ncbi:MAG: nucleotidyl transferase AbiEii/AbiGii toxin family protein [Candidatus Omnitrophica bacterium]|nr:nucleotidyl transferase AbiEii/AbiGii toxin family protein [Candidatus Omnitrophota bacterium]
MLSYDSLLEQAKLSDMPTSKMRGIMREYIQTLMLKYLYASKWQDRFHFLGGTSLRLVYGFKRFSEDLDFNIAEIDKREFERVSEFVRGELKKENIHSGVTFEHRGNLSSSKFTFKNVLEYYRIKDKRGILMVKFEANRPTFDLETGQATVSNFGEIFTLQMTAKGALFAEKIDALRHIKKGRHIYDIIIMLSKKFPISKNILEANGIREEPGEVIMDTINKFSSPELERLAQGLRPFLFKEEEYRLVVNAKIIIKDLLAKY